MEENSVNRTVIAAMGNENTGKNMTEMFYVRVQTASCLMFDWKRLKVLWANSQQDWAAFMSAETAQMSQKGTM